MKNFHLIQSSRTTLYNGKVYSQIYTRKPSGAYAVSVTCYGKDGYYIAHESNDAEMTPELLENWLDSIDRMREAGGIKDVCHYYKEKRQS